MVADPADRSTGKERHGVAHDLGRAVLVPVYPITIVSVIILNSLGNNRIRITPLGQILLLPAHIIP